MIITSFPAVLCYPVEDRIEALFSYLMTEVDMSSEAVMALMCSRPNLLGLSKPRLEQMLGFLLNNGTEKEEIIRLLQTSL